MIDKPHILIVEARFYDDLLDAMLTGAKRVLDKAGATYEIVTVPGALEIPGAIKFGHEAGNAGRLERRFDGYIALGCVIRGETTHYDTASSPSRTRTRLGRAPRRKSRTRAAVRRRPASP
jgi:6,7-dimethyl-8-ribityllumazine synthase